MILIPAKLSTQIKNAEAEFNNPIATQNIESIKKEEGNLELAGLYWHFVDIVWIVIFTVVYLISANDGAPLL